MTKIPQDGWTGSMVNNFYLGSILYVHILCSIELESISTAVRADNNLNMAHSFLETDLLLIFRTVSLIH